MDTMNIWYLSAYDQPKGHSSRTYDYALEMVKRGHQVTMFTNSYCHWTHKDHLSSNEKFRIEEIDGIRVVWLGTFHYIGNGWKRGVNMLSNAWRCFQAVETLADNPDVVIGPSVPLVTGWVAARLAKKKRAAFVFEVRDVWPIALVDNGGLSPYNPVYFLFRFIEKFLYRNSQKISSALPFIYDHVSQSGADSKKVTWIPNGIDFRRFAELKNFDGGLQFPLTAMYIGGFGTPHDVITIVKAAKILQEQGNDQYRFVIIGDGIKKGECESVARLYELTNIEFRESVPKLEVVKLQMEADILIACVTDSDIYRFGINMNKLYDYFASGRPVIFSGKAPNNPITETGAGYSVPPENPEAMTEALKSYLKLRPVERVEMGKRGRLWVEEEFDIVKLGDRMELLLTRAINYRE